MFSDICSLEQLARAYYRARKGKREKARVCEFDFSLENNLIKLRYLLESGKYIPAPYAHFTIYDPKTRSVSAPAFRDRVLQHSLVESIEPLFERKFIVDSYACRDEKGTHYGAKRVKKFLMAARCKYGKQQNVYVLQCDIQKYFQSIDWNTLLFIVAKTIHCPKTLDLIKKIVENHDSTNGKPMPANTSSCQLDLFSPSPSIEVPPVSVAERKGLPIGNLTSQLFANVYLNELDHYVKETLQEKWYARYMDDFLIIHKDKDHLKAVRDDIRFFLKEKLKLNLHPRKISIKNVREGVPFVGYRIFYDHKLVRGETLIRLQRKYRKRQKLLQQGKITENQMQMSEASVRGHLKHADAHGLYTFMTNNCV